MLGFVLDLDKLSRLTRPGHTPADGIRCCPDPRRVGFSGQYAYPDLACNTPSNRHPHASAHQYTSATDDNADSNVGPDQAARNANPHPATHGDEHPTAHP